MRGMKEKFDFFMVINFNLLRYRKNYIANKSNTEIKVKPGARTFTEAPVFGVVVSSGGFLVVVPSEAPVVPSMEQTPAFMKDIGSCTSLRCIKPFGKHNGVSSSFKHAKSKNQEHSN